MTAPQLEVRVDGEWRPVTATRVAPREPESVQAIADHLGHAVRVRSPDGTVLVERRPAS